MLLFATVSVLRKLAPEGTAAWKHADLSAVYVKGGAVMLMCVSVPGTTKSYFYAVICSPVRTCHGLMGIELLKYLVWAPVNVAPVPASDETWFAQEVFGST